MSFDRDFWERRWEQALSEHPERVRDGAPNAHVLAETAHLRPGRALDAGCGHGAEATWLAAQGWHVTAVDFSATALQAARQRAQALGVDGHLSWVEGDLGSWAPAAEAFDLVTCVYVHVAGSVPELVTRLGSGVRPGGTLLLVGHQPVDPAAGQVQVSVADALQALGADRWEVVVAHERPRAAAGSGVDAVIRAVRR